MAVATSSRRPLDAFDKIRDAPLNRKQKAHSIRFAQDHCFDFKENKALHVMIDYELILWFNSGIGIGFVILTTLLLFPGMYECAKEGCMRRPTTQQGCYVSSQGVEQRETVKNKSSNSRESRNDDRKTKQTIEPPQSSSMEEDVDQGQYAFTPYQKMNFCVYVIIFVVAGVILDREYGGLLGIWLRFYFPKEAAILGYAPVVERVRG